MNLVSSPPQNQILDPRLGLSPFLLYVTHNRTNAIYPGRQGRPGIKINSKLNIQDLKAKLLFNYTAMQSVKSAHKKLFR